MYKIWAIDRRSRAVFASAGSRDSGALRRAIRIVVESGLMYSAGVVVFFVVYLAGNNAQYGVSDCVSALCPSSPPCFQLPENA